MKNLIAFFGSPRRMGNTEILMEHFLKGVAETRRYNIEKIFLRDLKISPCLEIYKCKENGRCIIDDDFQKIYDMIENADIISLSTPVMFYTVSAHTKILMDRCQSFWVKKYILEKNTKPKEGYLFSVGATKGAKLFDGITMTVKYFFDTFDCTLKESVLVRGVDEKGEIEKYPEILNQAYLLGKSL
ncbi:MAG: flavodoxin family protein [Proteobacteria bacterium]|nr:flavodoxin family protein [Pseudomonadota bacterium]